VASAPGTHELWLSHGRTGVQATGGPGVTSTRVCCTTAAASIGAARGPADGLRIASDDRRVFVAN